MKNWSCNRCDAALGMGHGNRKKTMMLTEQPNSPKSPRTATIQKCHKNVISNY